MFIIYSEVKITSVTENGVSNFTSMGPNASELLYRKSTGSLVAVACTMVGMNSMLVFCSGWVQLCKNVGQVEVENDIVHMNHSLEIGVDTSDDKQHLLPTMFGSLSWYNTMLYSRKYWQSLNLAVCPQTDCKKILAEFVLSSLS